MSGQRTQQLIHHMCFKVTVASHQAIAAMAASDAASSLGEDTLPAAEASGVILHDRVQLDKPAFGGQTLVLYGMKECRGRT
jgi:hypothetical protein